MSISNILLLYGELENYPALPGLEKLISKKGNCLPTLKLQKFLKTKGDLFSETIWDSVK